MATIEIEHDDDVATFVLSNQPKRNALSAEMLARLAGELDRVDARAVLLTGAGSVFCAGADLEEIQTQDTAMNLERLLHEAAQAIETCPVPVVAAIEGACLGAGVELAAACDLRIVSVESFFEIPAARIGILYRPEGVERLIRAYGTDLVRQLLLANLRLRADQHPRLASQLSEAGGAKARAFEIASRIARLSSNAVIATKRLLHHQEARASDGPDWEAIRAALWEEQS